MEALSYFVEIFNYGNAYVHDISKVKSAMIVSIVQKL